MLKRPAFIKLRAYATNQAFTPDQIRNASRDQIQTHLGLTDDEVKQYKNFWSGMEQVLLRDALEREEIERLTLIKQQLTAAYPNAVFLNSDRVRDAAIDLLPYLYGEVE